MKKLIAVLIMLIMIAVPVLGMCLSRSLNTTEDETGAIVVSCMFAEMAGTLIMIYLFIDEKL
jgi:hypothetical protein